MAGEGVLEMSMLMVEGDYFADRPQMKVDLVRMLHRRVGEGLQAEQQARKGDARPVLTGEAERQYARKLIADEVGEYIADQLGRGEEPLTSEAEVEIAEIIHARMFGAGKLQRLLDDPLIENIDINGCDEVWVSRSGGIKERGEPVADSDEELVELIQTLAAYSGLSSRPFDTANPQLDLRLPDGSRLSAVLSVSSRPAISIRRHRLLEVTLSDLVNLETLTPEAADFISAVVQARYNVIIGGATDAGKTTFLRACASEINPEERLVTIEKALELGLRGDEKRHPDCVELEERVANSEGHGAVTMQELVRRSLRMNPDRVICGEVLGPEIVTMLNAMSQGNDGSLSTIHARTAREVFNRIATYALQAEERMPKEATDRLIGGGLDFVFYLTKDRATKQRRLTTVLEINGADPGILASEIFAADPEGITRRTNVAVARADGLVAAGWQDGLGPDGYDSGTESLAGGLAGGWR